MSSLPKIVHPVIDIEVLSQKKTYRFRPFGIDSEKALLLAGEDKTTPVIETILEVAKECCLDPINIDALSIFDVEWIFVKLRQVSVSDNLAITIHELKDNKNTNLTIPMSNIKHDEVTEPGIVKLENSDISFKLKYPSAREFAAPKKAAWKEVANHIDYIQDGENVIDLKQVSEEEQKEFFGKMTSIELKEVLKFIKTRPTVYLDVNLPNGTTQRLRGINDFFRSSWLITP